MKSICYNNENVYDQHLASIGRMAEFEFILAALKKKKTKENRSPYSWCLGDAVCYLLWLLRFIEVIKNPSPM
jgi:hypothetical protein